ncbi:DUF4376 domain-containing protein [Acidovorax sp. GBBC 3332]|nr:MULTISPECIES: DUF4376 domain-containing protein [unclassified Acidovorax]MDA8448485.1 DUF4376 domain-containing protein [Acidovorax sp. GBBC 3297]MDA8457548.1 DUF4376 domain-containing protein [Acidovorax sp. GBBC 3333]MDA8462928.1 DUF4376 domain-containing protein [Acidovorax sp. GBBC 3332]MDA8467618.1 DUF4376 domain-containing protein [Acidovorax sp. GBBC 3299]
MQIINTETQRWPMSVQDVMAEEQAAGVIIVIGEGYQGHGPYRVVTIREQPAYDPLAEAVVAQPPAPDEDGRWFQDFAVRLMSAEETASALQADKGRLQAAATAQRWAVETGGVTLPSGTRVGTTVEDQNRISTVIGNAQLAGITQVDFKAKSGWVSLSLDDLRGIASAIAQHVQACFSAERAHHEAIEAVSTRAQAEAYDVTEGWPSGN